MLVRTSALCPGESDASQKISPQGKPWFTWTKDVPNPRESVSVLLLTGPLVGPELKRGSWACSIAVLRSPEPSDDSCELHPASGS